MTLMELMTVVVIIGILAAIAFPSYRAYIQRARRGSAQAYMMAVSAREQQLFVDLRSYEEDLDKIAVAMGDKLGDYYEFTLDVDAGPPPGFTITAKPIGGQASDKCGEMTLDQNNARTAAKSECW
jgi:type IV pilus assembly protein PilE